MKTGLFVQYILIGSETGLLLEQDSVPKRVLQVEKSWEKQKSKYQELGTIY